jgi:hypothetical protein
MITLDAHYLSFGKNHIDAPYRLGGGSSGVFFFCFFVTFRLRQHIGMTQLSAIEKPTISANDFYWRTAPNICGRRDVIGWGGEDPQSLLMGFSIVKKNFPSRYLGNGAS